MSDRIIIEELIGATLIRCDDKDGNLLWDVHFVCLDGVTREYMFISEEIARGFAESYCDPEVVAEVMRNGESQ